MIPNDNLKPGYTPGFFVYIVKLVDFKNQEKETHNGKNQR
jgi:hypothetical protein